MQIELKKSHEHAGRAYRPGNVIDIADDLGRWLCAIGVAQPMTTGKGPPARSTKPAKQPHPVQE